MKESCPSSWEDFDDLITPSVKTPFSASIPCIRERDHYQKKSANLTIFKVKSSHNAVHISFDSFDETLRCSFVPYLSAAFGRKGLSTFTKRPDRFYNSIASLLIFSENYSFSQNSLYDVLEAHTHRRRDDEGHLVATVFYGVSRSDVKELKENFSKTLSVHEGTGQVREWRDALVEIVTLPGHEKSNDQSDGEFVEKIVQDVYDKLFPKERIGIYSRMIPEIENVLYKQQWKIRSIGLWGMPGIGKTTLAEAIFEQLSCNYEVSWFLQDFHKSVHEKGIYSLLQEHLRNLPNQKLQQRALIVLDDVQNPLYVESFLEGLYKLSHGSLIIITSRDKQVFSQFRVYEIYKLEGLNKSEALKLASRCIFGKDVKEKNLVELSMKLINYVNGNPLSLRLYGEKMSSGQNLSEIENVFLNLKKTPPNQIIEVVMSSYNALNDNEKNILVYIACFFAGENVENTSQLLKDLGFFPEIGIHRLVETYLVNISDQKIEIHDVIQAVIREFIGSHRVWEFLTINHGENSELKSNKELKTISKCLLGTEDIEGISIDASNLNSDVTLSCRSMYNLRFLKIYYSKSENYGRFRLYRKVFESLPYGLRLLHWEYYPLQSMPQDFDPINLVELNMPYSQLQRLWGGTKNLKMLKRINLSHSQKLVEVNDLSEAPNLEKIDLQGCMSLQSFPSIRHLHKLQVVDLSGCTDIQTYPEFPSNIKLNLHPLKVKSLHELLDNQPKPSKLEPPETHVLDFLKFRSFQDSKNRIRDPDTVESSTTIANMIHRKALEISRSFQWNLTTKS